MEPLSSSTAASLHLPSFAPPPPFDFALSNPNSTYHHRFPPHTFSLSNPNPSNSSSSTASSQSTLTDPSSWPLPHCYSWESDQFHPLHRDADEQQRGRVTIASLEDGSIGLKLGKRTYYGEPAAAGGDEALMKKTASSNAAEAAPVAAGGSAATAVTAKLPASTSAPTVPAVAASRSAKNSSSNVSSTAIAKKQKSSAAAALPRCQVEGCKADLSASKDYHRRHKVCEAHSKASKVRVASLEQRFCQQCSRFHILTEFDEGKRSCRRRLAGHNERRRKPQQEPISLLSPRFALFPDSRVNALLDHPCFLQHRRMLAQQEAIANYQMLDLHPYAHCLSSASGGGRSNSLIDAGRALMVFPNDHHHSAASLALSNHHNSSSVVASLAPSAGASSPSISIVSDHQPSSEMAISGRALSLLSSPPLVSQINPSASSSSSSSSSAMPHLEPTSSSPSPYQLFSTAGVHPLPSQCHQQVSSCLTMGGGAAAAAAMDMANCKSLAMSNSSAAMFAMFPDQNNGFLNLHSGSSSQTPARPILDLMQVSSTESHHLHSQQQQQQADIPYTDLQGLSIFGRKTIL